MYPNQSFADGPQQGLPAYPDFEALLEENAILSRALGRVQQRSSQVCQDQARQIADLQKRLMQAQARIVIQASRIAYLQADSQALQAAHSLHDESGNPGKRLRDWWHAHFVQAIGQD